MCANQSEHRNKFVLALSKTKTALHYLGKFLLIIQALSWLATWPIKLNRSQEKTALYIVLNPARDTFETTKSVWLGETSA